MAAHPSRVAHPVAILFGSFTAEARTVIVRAQEEARGLRHGYLGTEHLLLAVFADAPVARGLVGLGIDADTIAADVEAAVPPGDVALVGHIPFTPRAKAIVAAAGALADGHLVEPRHVMRAIARCGDGIAAALLRERTGLDQDELVAEIDQRMSAAGRPMSAPGGDAAACSFCGKTEDQIHKMFPGPGVAICDQCVELCNTILGHAPSHPDRAELEARMDALVEQLDQLRRDLG